jgi:hypothetical protein
MIEEARNLVSTYFTKDQSGAALRRILEQAVNA